ncbi:hypothetical protein [Streptomyces sp. enrichment culture]|uniref:hypothetical protein n=1 Tax=Streptomyces sp. enrichment culture TaxID=1795815 RepID=UPI003F55CD31
MSATQSPRTNHANRAARATGPAAPGPATTGTAATGAASPDATTANAESANAVAHAAAPDAAASVTAASVSTAASANAEPDAVGAVRDAALWTAMLIRQFPELLTELAPAAGGAARSAGRSAPAPGPAEQAARAARLRAEREEALLNEQRHGLTVPGHTAAPIRLHVSDAIRDITDGVTELEEAVYDRLGLGRPRRADVPRRLMRLTGLLDRVAADTTLARHVRDEVRRMARRCARALGEVETMVRLPGRCPACDSVSLRAFPASRTVVCVNPGCRCGVAGCDCATDPAFRHVWAEDAWRELADAAGGLAEIAVRMEEAAPGDAAGATARQKREDAR